MVPVYWLTMASHLAALYVLHIYVLAVLYVLVVLYMLAVVPVLAICVMYSAMLREWPINYYQSYTSSSSMLWCQGVIVN